MSANSHSFDQIQDGWLPIAAAQYSFSPNHLSDEKKRKIALRSVAAEFFANQKIRAQYEAWGVDFGTKFLGLKFTVHDCHYFCAYEDSGIDWDSSEWRPPELLVEGNTFDEFREILLKNTRHNKFEQAANTCNKLAYRLMQMYADGFQQAVSLGSALIYARAASPLNPFTRIFPDQWRHFRIVDVEAGTAEGPTGEKLYSCHVQPSETPADAPELDAAASLSARNGSKAAAVSECKAWIISLLRASPNRRTHSMAELQDEAIRRWSNRLTERGFKGAYIDARREVPAAAWGKTGPRPRAGS